MPDASRLNPPRLTENQPRPKLNFSIELTYPGLKAAALRTSHNMTIEEAKKGIVTLNLDAGAKMDSDLLVRFTLPKDLTVHAVIRDDEVKPKKGEATPKEKTGTWAITVVAPQLPTATPRDVIVVLDRSGSMNGWKMVAARRAAARLIDSLSPEDNFSVIAFDDRMDVFTPESLGKEGIEALAGTSTIKMLAGTDRNRFAATSWLSKCDARGGTEMKKPLTEAINLLASTSKNREPVVVLVTDGQIGAEAQLLAAIEPKVGRTRFCVVGIDRAPNTSLLERIGQQTNGYVTFVESEDRLDDALQNLHRRIGRPDLLSVVVEAEGAEIIVDDTVPGRPADVFSGVPCIITGRYKRTGAKLPVLTLSAEKADGSGAFNESVTAKKSIAKGITDTWARAKVADLEDAYDSRRADLSALRLQIIELSVSSHILSRFTAFVAVDKKAQEISSSNEMTQPVESPDGWAMGTSLFAASAVSYSDPGGGFAGGSVSSLSATSSIGLAPTSRILRAKSSGPGRSISAGITLPLTGVGIPGSVSSPSSALVSLLEECLEKLHGATVKNPAYITVLVQRLSRIQSRDPRITSVIAKLNAYIALTSKSKTIKASTLTDAIKAVEDVLNILRINSSFPSFPPVEHIQGSYIIPKGREFWS